MAIVSRRKEIRIYQIASINNLATASSQKFSIAFGETFELFMQLARRCLDSTACSFASEVARRIVDSAEAREWCEIILELSRYCLGNDEIPNSSFTTHLDIDQGDEIRIVELLLWQLFGIVCKPGEQTPCPPLMLPVSLILGGRGILSIPAELSKTRGAVLDWRESIPQLKLIDGRRTDEFDWKWHTLLSGGPVIPLDDRSLTAARLQDTPIVSSRIFSENWSRFVDQAMSEVQEYSPQAGAVVRRFVTHVLPLLCGRQTIASASRQEALGLVFLPAVEDRPDQLTECLLHESMHQLLFRLESCARLFAVESPVDSLFYSPWRTDRRPLRMTLHGCFVFVAVADMYLWVSDFPRWNIDSDVAQARAYQRYRESSLALQVVQKYGKTTLIGKKVLDAIEADLSSIASRLCPTATDVSRIDDTLADHLASHANYLH